MSRPLEGCHDADSRQSIDKGTNAQALQQVFRQRNNLLRERGRHIAPRVVGSAPQTSLDSAGGRDIGRLAGVAHFVTG